MSAQLQGDSVSAYRPSNHFSATLLLEAGVIARIEAPTFMGLQATIAKLQPTEAANEGNAKPAAAQATAGKPASQAAAASAPAAAASAAGEQGKGAAASQPSATGAASSASSSAGSTSPDGASVTFDELKKAFLTLSTKADGRAKCESVLKPFGLGKLSEAKPEQYAAVLAEIKKASE